MEQRVRHLHLSISLHHFPLNWPLSHIRQKHSTGRRRAPRWIYKNTIIIQKDKSKHPVELQCQQHRWSQIYHIRENINIMAFPQIFIHLEVFRWWGKRI